MNLSLANRGAYIDVAGYTYNPMSYTSFWGNGFGYSYLEVDAGSMASNTTFTIYVGNSTSIMSSKNSACGVM